jgi:hypothetical protein
MLMLRMDTDFGRWRNYSVDAKLARVPGLIPSVLESRSASSLTAEVAGQAGRPTSATSSSKNPSPISTPPRSCRSRGTSISFFLFSLV